MNHSNGSIQWQNGNNLELKTIANGFHHDVAIESTENDSINGHNLLSTASNGVIRASNGSIPKLKFDYDSSSVLPFSWLPGEAVEQNLCGKEAWVILTNFRLFVCQYKTFHNVPLRSIEYVEMRELSGLHVHCKNGKVVRIGFDNSEDCSDWWRYITSSEASQLHMEDLFAFHYFKAQKTNSTKIQSSFDGDCEASMYVNEIRRLGFNTKKIWRTTEINSKFEICKTYPKFHIVPSCVSDDDLKRIAQFRSLGRFPSVVWRNQNNGAVLARSSQPEVGWFGWRCDVDEKLLPAIGRAALMDSNNNKVNMTSSVIDQVQIGSTLPFLVIDARSYAAAVANRAKGGGCECQEYYANCDIKFMSLPNIHAIRKSFQNLRALCLLGLEQLNWHSALEATKWLQYLSGLIKSSLVIVEAIDVDAQSTLVHCSDGWDRTPQLVSLAQLLLDPYYRTIKGFRILIEREWLQFGHKFADRCGHSSERDLNERCPVFFQWLDAVYQIMRQFPSAFEFNETFLVKLASHVYSCLFGTFLCNSLYERTKVKLKESTVSIWTLLLSNRKDFQNFLYVKTEKVLYPNHHVRCLQLWETMFINKSNPLSDSMHDIREFTRSLELDSGNPNSLDLFQRKNSRKSSREYSAKPILIGNGSTSLHPSFSSGYSTYSDTNISVSNSKELHSSNSTSQLSKNISKELEGSGKYNEKSVLSVEKPGQSSENDGLSSGSHRQSNSSLSSDPKEHLVSNGDVPKDQISVVSSSESIDKKSCANFFTGASESEIYEETKFSSKQTESANSPGKESANGTEQVDLSSELVNQFSSVKSSHQMSDSVHTLTGDSENLTESMDKSETPVNSIDYELRSSDKIDIPLKKNTDHDFNNKLHDHSSDFRRSIDDFCVSLKSNSPPNDINFTHLSRNNSMRRAHSSPDSPTLNRLQRTKSVPDVMAVSCISPSTEISKQYSSILETPQNDSIKCQHVPDNLAKFIDVDGLTIMHSFIDRKLFDIRTKHANEMAKLFRKYEAERQARISLQQQCQQSGSRESCSPASFPDFYNDENCSLADSNYDRTSLSSVSNEEGWEQVQFDDVQPTRWIPDHMSTTCLQCGCHFNMLVRKHHCRKCGGIFCDPCSNYQISVPEEQLYNPVRVCVQCYESSMRSKTTKLENSIQFDHF